MIRSERVNGLFSVLGLVLGVNSSRYECVTYASCLDAG